MSARSDRVLLLNMESHREQEHRSQPLRFSEKAPPDYSQPILVWGSSRALREIRLKLPNLSRSDCPVLIGGETGTGKGMLAREIHATSARKALPFVHVDCAALAPSMIESELYGHERGAFTGATGRRIGRFELAGRGTIFLDEIAELPLELQAKLLRVLQERSFERVGGVRTVQLGARVLAATNRSLSKEIESHRFRSDLYFRLAVVEMELPPLRERPEDIPALIEEARRVISIRLGRLICPPGDDALTRLARYSWPGNGREVFNLVERIAACWPELPFDALLVDQALGSVPAARATGSAPEAGKARIDLENVLVACGGNVSLASRKLGMARTTLRRRLGRLGAVGSESGGDQMELPLTGGAWLPND